METIYTYLKNSNTGDVIMKQEFKSETLKFPTNFYRNHKSIDKPDLSGYVAISEKTYKRLLRKQKKQANV